MSGPRDSLLRRQLRARGRLLASIAFGIVVAAIDPVPHAWGLPGIGAALLGWNAAVFLYLVLVGRMIGRSTHDDMRNRAQAQDEGRHTLLVLVVVATLVSLAGVAVLLSGARSLSGPQQAAHLVLAGITVVASWIFLQLMFALHYAHVYYADRVRGSPDGLAFPGTPDPRYDDFLYLSAVIGTSAQTADVTFTSSPMRRIALAHCVLAFFFNTTVIALTVNAAAGLL